MASCRPKRGAAQRRVELLARLAPIVRANVDAERMLRSVARFLAVETGQFCIVDFVGRTGAVRRLAIEHADASRRPRLRVACEDTAFDRGGRVLRLLASRGSELVARATGPKARALDDVRTVDGERVSSCMAAAVSVNGEAAAVLTLAVTSGLRRYDEADLAFLSSIADWVGLGLENALRREAQPRVSTIPPPHAAMEPEEQTDVRRTNPLRERASR